MKNPKLIFSVAVVLIAIAGAFASELSSDKNALVLTAYRNTGCDLCDTGQTLSDACVQSDGVRCQCLYQSSSISAFRKPAPTEDCIEAYRPRD